MDGPSRVAEQTRNGVRGIVQEIDELRCRFGATALNMLTPKAEVSPPKETLECYAQMSVRSGNKPKIPLKFEFVYPLSALLLLIIIPVDYPTSRFTYELRAPNRELESYDEELIKAEFDRVSERLQAWYDTQVSTISESITVVSIVQLFMVAASSSSIAEDEEPSRRPDLASNVPRAGYTCRKCRCLLFTSEEIDPHNLRTNSQLCSSMFLNEPTEWMQDDSEVEGKISCPRCRSRVGSYCWAGLMCSCGEWVTPAIKFTKSKIDLKYAA